MSEELKALKKQLLKDDRNGYDVLSAAELEKMEAYCTVYKAFLDAGKTERLSARAAIALRSLMKGLNKVILNREALDRDLENNWAVVAEGIQTILRREGYPKPYEALKALTRTNAHITRESIAAFIETLDVAESVKEELRALSPSTYTGVFR